MTDPEYSFGRPPVYDRKFAKTAQKLCRLGATNADLADAFAVDIRTIQRWLVSHDDFCHAIKIGKDAANQRVNRSLFERAVGYTFDSVHFSSYEGNVTQTPYREHVPPDIGAIVWWQKNREPDLWRERRGDDNPAGNTLNIERATIVIDMRGTAGVLNAGDEAKVIDSAAVEVVREEKP